MDRRRDVNDLKVRGGELAAKLRGNESRNVTFFDDDFPIFWDRAHGAIVTDVDGAEYIDCTSAFGVASLGHGNRRVAQAVADQAMQLMHGMGDVHPTEIRVRLLELLRTILPDGLSRAFLATTGSEAVEAALKTAVLATGKSRFAAYRGGYHGLSLGALAAAGIARFREPFAGIVGTEPLLLEYPGIGDDAASAASLAHDALQANDDVAALIVEPIQGRGGCVVPPDGYLGAIRSICDDLGIVLVVDEIFTGFCRTGGWFAVDREYVVPDILCIGKAMGSGVPISAAVARSAIMDAWPVSTGEALHTSTFLGNPLGCAAALATIDEMRRLSIDRRADGIGRALGDRLEQTRKTRGVTDVRGRGMLWGIELRDGAHAFRAVKNALAHGVIVSQAGVDGNVIALSPPLTVDEQTLLRAIDVIESAIEQTTR